MGKNILLILAILYLEALSSSAIDPVTVATLTKIATEQAAPFTETAFKRLHSVVFGSGRATRSTDVVVINKTGKSFRLGENNCDSGGWTGSMFPSHEIPAQSSVVYGAESYGFMTGATECKVVYQEIRGSSSFDLSVSNPYFGPVHATGHGRGLHVSKVLGRGNNNIVRFTISDNK